MGLASASFWRRSALSGEWRDLCLVNYAVEPGRLERFLPAGLLLDVLDGHAFVSLVALRFVRPRMFGVKAQGGDEFPQVNFRFYVRDGLRRGVVILAEHAPRRLITWGARSLFHEPFHYAPVQIVRREASDGALAIDYTLYAAGRQHRLSVRAEPEAARFPAGTDPYFFEQRPFGYSHSLVRGETTRYGVSHDVWRTHIVRGHEIAWCFGRLYGEAWVDLEHATPHSVLLAEGSTIHASLPERL